MRDKKNSFSNFPEHFEQVKFKIRKSSYLYFEVSSINFSRRKRLPQIIRPKKNKNKKIKFNSDELIFHHFWQF